MIVALSDGAVVALGGVVAAAVTGGFGLLGLMVTTGRRQVAQLDERTTQREQRCLDALADAFGRISDLERRLGVEPSPMPDTLREHLAEKAVSGG